MRINTVTGGKVEAADAVFACDYKEALVHQIVQACIVASHTGTRANKTRAEVSGGGRKPWRQKGGGRARAGSIRSPLARGGGVIFARKPHHKKHKMNRRMYRGAMRSLLSECAREGRLLVVEKLAATAKTQEMLAQLKGFKALKAEEKLDLLLVVAEDSPEIALGVRNLPRVGYCTSGMLGPVEILRRRHLLVTAEAMQALEKRLS